MEYTLGMKFNWIPKSKFEEKAVVEVVGLRKHGHAKLSNGWVVNQTGVAEGTGRTPGGHIEIFEN